MGKQLFEVHTCKMYESSHDYHKKLKIKITYLAAGMLVYIYYY